MFVILVHENLISKSYGRTDSPSENNKNKILLSIFSILYFLLSNNSLLDTNSLIIEYSKNPPNKGILEHATMRHRETNRVCADVVEVFLVIEDATLIEFSFDGYMSIVATALTAIVGESLVGEKIETILELDEQYIHSIVGDGISPRRRNASMMGLLAIKNAIHKYREDGIIEDFQNIMRV